VPPSYDWEQVPVPSLETLDLTGDAGNVINFVLSGTLAIKMTGGQPVYVSMTTISSRFSKIVSTIIGLLRGKVIPTHIYLFISEQGFLIDEGLSKEALNGSKRLMALYARYSHLFSIIYTKNIGPHRKLLPLLARKWNEDCVIVTLDDEPERSVDSTMQSTTLAQLITYYRASNRQSVVGLKVRRMGFCDVYPYFVLTYNPWWGTATHGRQEMLLLPTGTGGVLYRPSFFHPIVFDEQLRNITVVGDDLTFRLATMAMGIPVTIACRLSPKGGTSCPKEKDIKLFSQGEMEAKTMHTRSKDVEADAAAAEDLEELNRLNADNDEQSTGATADVALSISTPKVTPAVDKESKGEDNKAAKQKAELDFLLQFAAKDVSSHNDGKRDGGGVRQGGRKLGPGSPTLWNSFNRRSGNDKQWKQAVAYLQNEAKNILNITQLIHTRVPVERAPCFEAFWSEKYEGKVYVQPERAKQCMLKTCLKTGGGQSGFKGKGGKGKGKGKKGGG